MIPTTWPSGSANSANRRLGRHLGQRHPYLSAGPHDLVEDALRVVGVDMGGDVDRAAILSGADAARDAVVLAVHASARIVRVETPADDVLVEVLRF